MSPITVRAVREVPHSPERVYSLVSDLGSHWRLSNRYLRLEEVHGLEGVEAQGGRIVVAGPLGLRRTAHTTVTTECQPHAFGGVAAVGRRTRAVAGWRIEPAGGGAQIVLETTTSTLGPLDRLLLAFGGRWWLRRGFARVLARLAEALDAAASAERAGAVGAASAAAAAVA
jgi:hypothetical protein